MGRARVRLACRLRTETGRDILCPIALDDSWSSCLWPERLLEQILEYRILDFSNWLDDNSFGDQFDKLIEGLHLFYA